MNHTYMRSNDNNLCAYSSTHAANTSVFFVLTLKVARGALGLCLLLIVVIGVH